MLRHGIVRKHEGKRIRSHDETSCQFLSVFVSLCIAATRIVIPALQIHPIALIKSGTADVSPYHPHTNFRKKSRLVAENYKPPMQFRSTMTM